MYRKLVWMPVLLFVALAVAMAYLAGGPWDLRDRLPIAAFYAKSVSWLPTNAAGDLRLAYTFFLTGLVPMLLGLGLTWFTAFHPGRRTVWWLAALKYLAVLMVGAQLIIHIYHRAAGVATATHALGLQIAKPLGTLLLIGGLPHAVIEVAAISFILSAPLYWVLRGVRVASLQRATFEAWVEIRRLTVPAVVLLGLATAIQVWATPSVTAALLR
ncbi:MAG TPA: hypothetical protein VD973_21495 [Symbiobacteriaceae bacterium]|nr:hypothetical protein [Symbiobacteriaceae bacterium]